MNFTLVSRKSDAVQEEERCYNCNGIVIKNADYCGHCKAKLRIECPACSTNMQSIYRFCIKCGFDLAVFQREEYEKQVICAKYIDDTLPTLPNESDRLKNVANAEQLRHMSEEEFDKIYATYIEIVNIPGKIRESLEQSRSVLDIHRERQIEEQLKLFESAIEPFSEIISKESSIRGDIRCAEYRVKSSFDLERILTSIIGGIAFGIFTIIFYPGIWLAFIILVGISDISGCTKSGVSGFVNPLFSKGFHLIQNLGLFVVDSRGFWSYIYGSLILGLFIMFGYLILRWLYSLKKAADLKNRRR